MSEIAKYRMRLLNSSIFWWALLLGTLAIESSMVAWLGDALLAGMILGPLQLALFATAIGAHYGNARKGAMIGFGIFVVPALLIASVIALIYRFGG